MLLSCIIFLFFFVRESGVVDCECEMRNQRRAEVNRKWLKSGRLCVIYKGLENLYMLGFYEVGGWGLMGRGFQIFMRYD